MALDLKSAAIITRIAIQATKDDEVRNRIIFISVLLILAFIVYILMKC